MIGELTSKEMEHVLGTQQVGRIGCCDNGVAYVVPTSYAYVDGTVYAHTREGMKIQIMRKNPSVCFEVDHMEHMSHWKSVIAWGHFKEVTDPELRIKAIRILLARNLPLLPSQTVRLSSGWPFEPEDLSKIEGIIYSIELDKKSGRYEDDQQSPSMAG
jgi:nitroimidazol reductase NimA-like FMN-containing flavoprotein (pyridoxamine 5'-phosphate oxidase superfamily)